MKTITIKLIVQAKIVSLNELNENKNKAKHS